MADGGDGQADQSAQGLKKKEFEAEAVKLACKVATTEPVMVAILEARVVNQALGGAFVGPGDVDELQQELIDACEAIMFKTNKRERKEYE